ncbi:MAG: 4Fe-4S binding protein [Deltaproteobacteria bacterium]
MAFMLPVIIRNIFGGPATRRYPKEPRVVPERVRGRLLNDPEKCLLCGNCAKACPANCITVHRQERTWLYDPNVCVYCGVCVESCPAGSLSQETAWPKATALRQTITLTIPAHGKEEKEALCRENEE